MWTEGSSAVTDWLDHLSSCRSSLPLAVAAVLIPINERDPTLKRAIGFASHASSVFISLDDPHAT